MIWALGTGAVALLCSGIAGFAAYLLRHRLSDIARNEVYALMAPFAFPLVIGAWGVLFWWPSHNGTPWPWLEDATRWIFFVLYPSLCAFSIWSARRYRWLAVALIPLSLLIGLFAAGFAMACVTGD